MNKNIFLVLTEKILAENGYDFRLDKDKKALIFDHPEDSQCHIWIYPDTVGFTVLARKWFSMVPAVKYCWFSKVSGKISAYVEMVHPDISKYVRIGLIFPESERGLLYERKVNCQEQDLPDALQKCLDKTLLDIGILAKEVSTLLYNETYLLSKMEDPLELFESVNSNAKKLEKNIGKRLSAVEDVIREDGLIKNFVCITFRMLKDSWEEQNVIDAIDALDVLQVMFQDLDYLCSRLEELYHEITERGISKDQIIKFGDKTVEILRERNELTKRFLRILEKA